MKKNALIFCLLLLLLMAPSGMALANSAPPPSLAWFTLQFEASPAPRLQGLQLVGCADEACAQPVLLQQYGTCQAAGCLGGPVSLSGWRTSFACAANRCLSTAYPNHGGLDFRLVAQFSDKVRTSPVVNKLPGAYAEQAAWYVRVRAADLSIAADATIPAMNSPYERFSHNLGWLALSILVEVVVAGLGLQLLARSVWSTWLARLVVVFLANLATLPVVWLTFPALGQFQSVGSRLLAAITLVVVAFYVALLIITYRAPRKVRLWAIPVIVLVFLVSSAACLLMLALNYYGSTTIYVQGLSSTAVIVVSEAFAVIAEALLIAVLCRQSLRLAWVWAVSLAMNAASFLVGIWLVGR